MTTPPPASDGGAGLWRVLAAGAAAALLAAALTVPARAATAAHSPALRELGRRIFFDPSLSASGTMSCATCHDPRHAYGPPDGRAVRYGGSDLRTPGLRAVPSLRYTLNRTPRWSKQYQADAVERDLETDSVPTGGYAWDGRFDTLHQQAQFPFLAANEMGNADAAAVGVKLGRASYAADFRAAFGAQVFDDPAGALGSASLAIERFELEDASFRPYSSRFDAYLDGTATLDAAETRGLRLFKDPLKGNCAACHIATPGADGSHPLFTDFSFAALGVPRSREIPADADGRFFDLGLCGPVREDQAAERRWCGQFKTPSLRNAASRRVFFHNGRFHTLRDAVRFYAERDTPPARRPGPGRTGPVDLYDDLPATLRVNVDRLDAPLNRRPGDPPALTPAEVDDIVAFIGTLTDADVVPARAPPAAMGDRGVATAR